MGLRFYGKKRIGTTLIEVLVVMAVFLIGILAIAQVFPGGFKILNNSRDLAIADAVAKDRVSHLQSNLNELPDMILPVITGTENYDPNRSPLDPSIYDEANATINQNGSLTYGGINYADYHYYAGPNVFRHIVGDGLTIPPPSSITNYYGSISSLHYGPTRQLGPNESTPIVVYGSDYAVNLGDPPLNIVQNGQVYLTSATGIGGQLAIQTDDPTDSPQFRVSLVMYTTTGAVTNVRSVVSAVLPTATIGTFNGNFLIVNLSQLAPPGETYEGVIPDTIQVQRIFQQVAPAANFSQIDPYQYKVMNLQYGELLFNPITYNYLIQSANGATENLHARADYDVLDWQILRDRIRLQDDEQVFKLTFGGIKITGTADSDGASYPGLQLPNINGSGQLPNSDIVFIDELTGGIVAYDPSSQSTPALSSFLVDKSNGNFSVNDFQANTAGNQIQIYTPDPTTASGFSGTPIVVNANGRVIDVLYRAKGDWSVQPLVASAIYYPSAAAPGPGQYEVGLNSRVYFARMDIGRKVSVDDLYYVDGSGVVHEIQGQSFVVRNVPADPNGAYIDVKDFDPNAVSLDFSHGYAVNGIHGVSVAVRVTKNPDFFGLDTVPLDNANAFDKEQQSIRQTIFETYASRG